MELGDRLGTKEGDCVGRRLGLELGDELAFTLGE
jgi:hypothetical protein